MTSHHPYPSLRYSGLLLALFILSPTQSTAEIYRWLDSEGKVHYGDKPTRSLETERIEVSPRSATSSAEAQQLRQRLLKQAREVDERRQEEKAKSATEGAKKQQAIAQAQRCTDARKRLAKLQEQLPIYRDGQGRLRVKWIRDTYKGQREYLDDPTRAAEINLTRQEIASACTKPEDMALQKQAHKEWILSEHCAAARADLESLLRPGANASRYTIEQTRKAIETACR